MSDITIYIQKIGKVEPRFRIQLKRITNRSLTELDSLLQPKTVFLREEIFLNDHELVAEKIKSVINVLKEAKVTFSIHEMGEGHELENPDIDYWRISEETLGNILDGF